MAAVIRSQRSASCKDQIFLTHPILVLPVDTQQLSRALLAHVATNTAIPKRRHSEQETGELIASCWIGAVGLQGAAAGVVGDIGEIAVFVGIGVCERGLQPPKVFPKGKGVRAPHLGEIVSQLVGVADAVGVRPSSEPLLDDIADAENFRIPSLQTPASFPLGMPTAVFSLVPRSLPKSRPCRSD